MKYILILLLSICSFAKADERLNIDFQYRDGAFIAGYVFASVYDFGYGREEKTNVHEVGWKMGLGILAGVAVAIGHSNRESVAIPFSDVVFGGLGGLTCTVFHW